MAHPAPAASLPISTQQASSQTAPPPPTIAATPAFRAFLSHLSSSVRQSLSHRRPWYELLDRSAFSRPASLSDATSRLRKNASYFRVNYAIAVSAVLAFSLLSHPFSLLTLLFLLASWLLLYVLRSSADPPIVLFGRTFSDREILAGLGVFTVVVVFLTSVGSLLISALMFGLAIVAAHGAFRVPEDLFLDDQEPAGGGLLSFLGGSVPPVAARV